MISDASRETQSAPEGEDPLAFARGCAYGVIAGALMWAAIALAVVEFA